MIGNTVAFSACKQDDNYRVEFSDRIVNSWKEQLSPFPTHLLGSTLLISDPTVTETQS
jgi:hypothetical protein